MEETMHETPLKPWEGGAILAPLTKGGNLPFRRLCVEFGARVTLSEMAYSRFVVRRTSRELALVRKHASEECFGVQIAATNAEEAVGAGLIAVERGASFIDLNVGCPIHDTVRRGMGACLLQRSRALEKIVSGMVQGLPVPVTVKIRTGWNESEINLSEISKVVEDAGAAALTVHGRTREQRYSKAANWELIGQAVAERKIPVIGNGDILTYYEARDRRAQSRCAAVMIGRGALIKPWVFKELKEGITWIPTPEDRVSVYRKLALYMKEHFRDDEKGKKRAMQFLPWHFSFFCRYRPLPEGEWLASSREHPLIQSRLDFEPTESPLELLLQDTREETHLRIAEILWESASDEEAVSGLLALSADGAPARSEIAQLDEFAVSAG